MKRIFTLLGAFAFILVLLPASTLAVAKLPSVPISPIIPVLPSLVQSSDASDFEFSVNDGKATVTGYNGSDSIVIIPSNLGGCPVTAIGNASMGVNKTMTSVVIPEGVVSIGSDAFTGCANLTSVSLPSTLTSIDIFAFDFCTSLTSISLPSNLTELGECAFAATPIASLTIPKGLTQVSAQTFAYCDNLKDFQVDPGNPAYAALDGILYNKDYTELIYYPTGRMDPEVSILDTIKIIGAGAFTGNKYITEVNLPESLLEIRSNAFSGCKKISAFNVPAYTEKVEKGAFAGCEALASATFLGTQTEIGDDLFAYCHALAKVELPGNLSIIPLGAFYWCTGLQEIVIPDTVTSINTDAFRHCINLSSLQLPGSLQYIGYRAFYDCPALPSLTLPGPLQTIDDHAFAYCVNLPSVTIPGKVTTMGEGAFEKCSKLHDARFMGDAPPIVPDLFTGCAADFRIYYPAGKSGWTTPYWFTYPAVPYNSYTALPPALHSPVIYYEVPKITLPVRPVRRSLLSTDLILPGPDDTAEVPPVYTPLRTIPAPSTLVETPSAANGTATIQFYLGQASYMVNGQNQIMDATPIIVGGRMLLPVRYVAEPLGATTLWNEESRKVTITLGDKMIEVWIDNNAARVNGLEKPIDPDDATVKPVIVSGRTMLPLRFIAENLGCDVKWNESLHEATLTR